MQLTFELPHAYFHNFKTIYVYPDFYYSEGMQQYNAGEVHKSGQIYLSWVDFLEGYLNPNNARNLGLHEMAHALRLENMIQNKEYGYFKWSDIQEFNHYTVIESNRIKAGEESLLLSYAATYYHEFFAVVIEVFFEQPKQLKEYHPPLYAVTARLLRQDPFEIVQEIVEWHLLVKSYEFNDGIFVPDVFVDYFCQVQFIIVVSSVFSSGRHFNLSLFLRLVILVGIGVFF